MIGDWARALSVAFNLQPEAPGAAFARRARHSCGRLPMGVDEVWKLDGHELRVTNLDKVFWPDADVTKGDLLRYYRDLAPTVLPYLRQRPFIMRLWPDGITGKGIYRWRVPRHAPAWLERFPYQLQTANKTAEMPVVGDLPALLWVVNQGVIELHPWVATRDAPAQPTFLFFDLDPIADLPFRRVLEVGRWIGERLDALGLQSWAKTSGSDGLHIFVPLTPGPTFEAVRAWLGRFIEELDRRHPGAVTSDKRLAQRAGKVLVDYSQNALAKTIAAPYSVRAKPGAPVSMPLHWAEVESGALDPRDFTIRTAPERLAAEGDLCADMLRCRQQLPEHV
jgi:bifunctional non-homologous end joining protein LigD